MSKKITPVLNLHNIHSGEMVLPADKVRTLMEFIKKYQGDLMKAMLIQPSSMLSSSSITFDEIRAASQPPLESAGIRVGEITAYRLWRATGHRLRSVAHDDVWPPGQPMTGDPRPGNSAGVYAFRERADAEREISAGAYDYRPSGLVLGTVRLWGRYVEHERGFRAENARIASLDNASPGVDLDAIRTLYVDRRCPPDLTPVVDQRGRVVGVTTIKPPPKYGSTYSVCRPSSITGVPNPMRPPEIMVSYQTHHWRGKALLLEADQDPTWLAGWLPL